MKTTNVNLLIILLLTATIWFWLGSEYSAKQIKSDRELIELQSDSIRTLENRLQTSNEKRGRLFLALLYTDIPGREKELDSLLIEIGKDN